MSNALLRGIIKMVSTRRLLSFIPYKKELMALVVFFVTIFITVSLYSYCMTDLSWFYYTSHPHSIENLCGTIGSNLAAFLFFLMGVAAYMLIPLGILLSYWLTLPSRWDDEWERILAAVGLLITSAALLSLYHVIIKPGVMGGGYIGFSIALLLGYVFDRIESLALLYTMSICFFIIMFRFFFIKSMSTIWNALLALYKSIVNHDAPFQLYAYLKKTGWLLIRPFFIFVRFSVRLLGESENVGLLINEEQEKKKRLPLCTKPHAILSPVVKKNKKKNYSKEIKDVPTQNQRANDPLARDYGLPSTDIFIGIKEKKEDKNHVKDLENRAAILEQKLERFGVSGKVIAIKNGPVVTLFEYQPNIDTKISKILALEDDLALALRALSIRILAPIPGRSVVGFEVANIDRRDVLFSQVIKSPEYDQFNGSLPLILGQDTVGNNVIVDLAKMPHLLIAGSTGSGKSVGLNAMLTSLLCGCTPDQLKLILIDPKRLEFAQYADIAHLLFPIITDPRRTVPILRWVVHQMEMRYEKMAQHSARNIDDYNARAARKGEEIFPFIVVVIDELSDLMLMVGREIEDIILRITQMARAAGIHMIVATQRPSVDVITGLIKVNFPSRISFRVTSRIDSRTILDCGGADKLLGRGDMLFLDSTVSMLRRIHGAYVSDQERGWVVSHIKKQRTVEYHEINEQFIAKDSDISGEDEDLYKQIIIYLEEVETVSISLLQRKFRIGYNKSARMIEMLETRGLIMPPDGSKTRRVIR